jgi:uncharacterized protein YjbI with pentapeptide repeats
MRLSALALTLLTLLPVVLHGGEHQVEQWEGIECFVTHDAKLPSRPVVELDFIGCDLKDVDLKKLTRVQHTLRSINLRYNGNVTDAGLKELAGLEHLEIVYLPATNIGDAGVQALLSLTRLRELNLAGTRITDAGLKKLAAVKHLHYLDLSFTAVTDAAVQRVHKAVPQCKIINHKR